ILLEMLDMNKYGRAEGDVQLQQKRVYVKYVIFMTLFELTLSMKLMKGCIRLSKLQIAVVFISADDGAILCNYLPLIREYLPETAVEIESGIRESREGFIYFFIVHSSACNNYVYDLYTVGDDLVTTTGDTTTKYPLSLLSFSFVLTAAECNPRNDYPDEESSGDEAEGEDRDEFFDDLEHSDSDSQLEEVKFDEVDFDES
ncbi:hypothetical protein B296_00011487, partial [Ensete ventricosum]